MQLRITMRAAIGTCAVALGLGVMVSAPASAGPSDDGRLAMAASATAPGVGASATVDAADAADAGAMAASYLQRHEGLDGREARERVAAQDEQSATAQRLEDRLGARAAGSYIDQGSGDLVITVTDPAAVRQVRAAGAVARQVEHSGAALEKARRTVESHARDGAGQVTSWYTDVDSNTVVVTVPQGPRDADTRAFLQRARAAGPVTVVEQAGQVRTQANLYGGQQIEFSGFVCSVGFNAFDSAGRPVFTTAGHCAEGNQSFTRNGTYLGQTRGWSFPGNDYAYSSVDTSRWTIQGAVDRYDGYGVRVTGSSNAAVGTIVCKSGRTTGWTCGRVKAKNVTVNYAEGAVYGLTQASACTEGGDSGGAWLAGGLAQGITSGGSSIDGRCLQNFGRENIAYFQPIGEVLSRYNLALQRG